MLVFLNHFSFFNKLIFFFVFLCFIFLLIITIVYIYIGKLIDRNSMDLIINKKGHMVTIPLNFVRCVRLAIPNDNDNNHDNPGMSSLNTRRGGNAKMSTFEDDDDDEEDVDIDDTDEDDE